MKPAQNRNPKLYRITISEYRTTGDVPTMERRQQLTDRDFDIVEILEDVCDEQRLDYLRELLACFLDGSPHASLNERIAKRFKESD